MRSPHRLGDVVVCSGLQHARDVCVAIARSGEDNRRARRAGADFLHDLQPVGVGQLPVEQVQVERLARERALQGMAAVEVMADMTTAFQPRADERRLVGVILEIRDAHAEAVYPNYRRFSSR
jgi:hypothetical protein